MPKLHIINCVLHELLERSLSVVLPAVTSSTCVVVPSRVLDDSQIDHDILEGNLNSDLIRLISFDACSDLVELLAIIDKFESVIFVGLGQFLTQQALWFITSLLFQLPVAIEIHDCTGDIYSGILTRDPEFVRI